MLEERLGIRKVKVAKRVCVDEVVGGLRAALSIVPYLTMASLYIETGSHGKSDLKIGIRMQVISALPKSS